MNKKIFRYTLSGILFTSILGTLSHFLYGWSGSRVLVGLFAPVNESVWEHMKLLFFPMLLYFVFERLMLEHYPPSLSCADAMALLAGTCLIPTIFYTYTGILGRHLMVLDIATFYVSVIAAFLLRRRFFLSFRSSRSFRSSKSAQPRNPHRKKTGKTLCLCLTAAVLLVFTCFLVFTYSPPELGLFLAPS